MEREQRWQEQYLVLEAAITRSEGRGDSAFSARLHEALDDIADERCEICGKFEDDPNDLHAEWCRWATCPRPSIDSDSDVPVLEQVKQILTTLQMWGRS
jgi:hypothetical protein